MSDQIENAILYSPVLNVSYWNVLIIERPKIGRHNGVLNVGRLHFYIDTHRTHMEAKSYENLAKKKKTH